jgi:hypothetical protein
VAIEFASGSLVYNALKDLGRWILRRFGKPDPEAVVLLRQQWKDEIEARLGRPDEHSEAIIRDVKRADSYPHLSDKEKGISAWFRVGLLGVYHRGIQVGLRIEALVKDPAVGWRLYDSASEQPDLNAYVVGLIPFERIVNIDWGGDEYYYVPHIYCRFTGRKKQPYEQVVFSEKRKLERPGTTDIVYFTEIAKYDDVMAATKKAKRPT